MSREGLQDLRRERHGFAVAVARAVPPRHVVDRAGTVVATITVSVVADYIAPSRSGAASGTDVAKAKRVGVSASDHHVLRGLLAAATVGENGSPSAWSQASGRAPVKVNGLVFGHQIPGPQECRRRRGFQE